MMNKLSPHVLKHLNLEKQKDRGFLTILTNESKSLYYSTSSEIGCFRDSNVRIFNTCKIANCEFAKRWLRKNICKISKAKIKVEELVKNDAAVKIQNLYRAWSSRRNREFLNCMGKLQEIRNQAAKVIQRAYRIKNIPKRLAFAIKVYHLVAVREKAAKCIQKNVKGYLVRRDLPFLRHKGLARLVTWPHPARSVSLAGNFTIPNWDLSIPLFYSSILKQFYTSFFIENKLKSGFFLVKFIVDGEWVCNGSLPVRSDENGNYNNILLLDYEQKPFIPKHEVYIRSMTRDRQQKQHAETSRVKEYTSLKTSIFTKEAFDNDLIKENLDLLRFKLHTQLIFLIPFREKRKGESIDNQKREKTTQPFRCAPSDTRLEKQNRFGYLYSFT